LITAVKAWSEQELSDMRVDIIRSTADDIEKVESIILQKKKPHQRYVVHKYERPSRRLRAG